MIKEHLEDCLDCARTSHGRKCPYIKKAQTLEGVVYSKDGKMQYCPKYLPEWVKVPRAVVTRIVGISPYLFLKGKYTPDWAVEEAKKRGVSIRFSMTIDCTINYPVFYLKVGK